MMTINRQMVFVQKKQAKKINANSKVVVWIQGRRNEEINQLLRTVGVV